MLSKMSPWLILRLWQIRFWFVRRTLVREDTSIFEALKEGRGAPTQQECPQKVKQ